MAIQNILQKNAPNTHSKIHLTLIARFVVYFIKTNFVKTKGQDLILDNKDTHNQEVTPDLDIPTHLTLDSNPIIERTSSTLTKTIIKRKETTDLAAIPMQGTPAGTDPVPRKEKEVTQ